MDIDFDRLVLKSDPVRAFQVTPELVQKTRKMGANPSRHNTGIKVEGHTPKETVYGGLNSWIIEFVCPQGFTRYLAVESKIINALFRKELVVESVPEPEPESVEQSRRRDSRDSFVRWANEKQDLSIDPEKAVDQAMVEQVLTEMEEAADAAAVLKESNHTQKTKTKGRK